jgi:ribonuclease P protein component
VLSSGRRRRGEALVLQLRANGLSYGRLGLIVPKRHVPLAVDRNRIKRLVREWFRHRQHGLAGRDVLVRLNGAPASAEDALAELKKLLPEDS